MVHSNRGYGPKAILQIVEDRLTSPHDRVEDVITRAESDEITLNYRKLAGFEVNELNRSKREAIDLLFTTGAATVTHYLAL